MEVKSIYPIINFSDEDEIAVQYERLGADGVIIISPDFSDEAMLIKKIRISVKSRTAGYISGSHTEDLRILRKCFMQGQQVPGSRQQSRH